MGNRPSREEKIELRLLAQASVRLIRHRDGLTQLEVAALVRSSQQVISLVERGRPRAPVRVLRELIAAAGIIRAQDQQRAPAGDAEAAGTEARPT